MGIRVNLTGRRFGKWLVLWYTKRRSGGKAIWVCQCDCGIIREVVSSNLLGGLTTSCGTCTPRKGPMTHGASYTPEYRIWAGIKTRCCNKNSNGYTNYGKRGIQICSRWLDSFETFLADMGPRPSSKHSIDRIDNDGDYTPENCRWTTGTEQCNNKQNNHLLSAFEKTLTLTEWAKVVNMPEHVIRKRLNRGYTAEEALYSGRYKTGPNTAGRRPDILRRQVEETKRRRRPNAPRARRGQHLQ
jgi:hypothetical protein